MEVNFPRDLDLRWKALLLAGAVVIVSTGKGRRKSGIKGRKGRKEVRGRSKVI